MTAFRQRWQRSAAVAATGVAALVGTGIFAAAPASAHTPVWSVDCSSVTVDLSAYNAGVTNTVSLDAGSKHLLAATDFKDSFSKKIQLPKHSSPLNVHLVVKAGDGDQYSRDETKVSPVCPGDHQKPSPTPSHASPAPSQSSSEAPAPTPSKPSHSAPAHKPSGGLAETGSSSATPMIAGIAGVVVIAGVGMVVVARRRRTSN